MYQPISYPRSLYLDGRVESDRIEVKTPEAEAEARTRGYRKAFEPPEKKAEQPSRDEMLVALKAAGVSVSSRWSDERMAEELAKV